MRIRWLLALAVVCVMVPAENLALGSVFRIASFSDSRSYKYFLGVTENAGASSSIEGYDWYSTMRNWLTAPGTFGPDVTVTLHEVSDGRVDLAGQGYNLLIMNEVAPLSGSAADQEASAIAQFVLGGGCVVIIADTLQCGQGNAMGNKTLAAIDGGSESSGRAGRYGSFVQTDSQYETASSGHFSLDPGPGSNLVWGGSFNYQIDGTDQADPFAGTLSEVLDDARFGCTDHVGINPGSWSQVIGKRAIGPGPNPTLSNVMMEILGSTIDAGLSGSGAGNVLVVGDTIFANDMVYPIAPGFGNADPSRNNNDYNNARILLNFVQQQVPEPGSLMLLAVGAAAMLGGYFWRRRAAR
jgi:hypothetical protein